MGKGSHDKGMLSLSWMWTLPFAALARVCNEWDWLLAQFSSCSDSGCGPTGTPPRGFCLHWQNAGGSFLQGTQQ